MNRFWDLLLITVFFVFDPKPLFGQNDFLDLNVAAKQEKIRKDGFTDHNQFNEQFDKIRQRSEGAHIENELKWEELRSEALLAYKKDKSRRKKPILVQNESDNDEHFKDYLKEQEKNQRNYDENQIKSSNQISFQIQLYFDPAFHLLRLFPHLPD